MSENKVPRAIRSRQIKDKIFDVAIKLIKEFGYEATTVSMICKAAEVSNGTFYHFYESKESLILGLFSLSEVYLQKNLYVKDNPIEEICHIYHVYNDFLIEQGFDIVRAFYNGNNYNLSLNSILASNNHERPVTQRIEEQIKRGVMAGYFKDTGSSLLVSIDITTIVLGIRMRWIASEGTFDLHEMTERILRIYLNGIKLHNS